MFIQSGDGFTCEGSCDPASCPDHQAADQKRAIKRVHPDLKRAAFGTDRCRSLERVTALLAAVPGFSNGALPSLQQLREHPEWKEHHGWNHQEHREYQDDQEIPEAREYGAVAASDESVVEKRPCDEQCHQQDACDRQEGPQASCVLLDTNCLANSTTSGSMAIGGGHFLTG